MAITKYNVNVQVSISNERIGDLFVSAIEGGSNYWLSDLKVLGKSKGPYYLNMVKHGFTVAHTDPDTGDYIGKVKVTPKMIEMALENFALKQSKHFGDFLRELEDSITADQFMQWCVIGNSIYG